MTIPNGIYPGSVVRRGSEAWKERILRPWRWKLPEGTFPLPEGIQPVWFSCGLHLEGLAPYTFEGEQLYVCRICGNVYAKNPKGYQRGASPLVHWKASYRQRYDWSVMRPGRVNYDFVHCQAGIRSHPIIDAHGTGDPVESAQLIARFFTYFLMEDWREGYPFFKTCTEKKRIQADAQTLIISEGKDTGNLAKDRFLVYREEKDSLSLDLCYNWNENVFGYTCDVNLEDWELYATRQRCVISYLGPDRPDLDGPVIAPDGREVRIGQRNEGEESVDWEILEAPFDLEGFYLFERRIVVQYLGTLADDFDDDEDDEDDEDEED